MDVPRLLEGMAQSADAADAILADLQTAFSETWRSQTGLVISAIFDKKTGLLAFLKQRRNDVSPKAKSLAFRLLADVFDKLNASVKTHSADVQTVCWAYFSSKESAAVKRSTVFVTLTLVENKLLQSDEVKALFDRYLATFIQSETKLVSTVKSSVLELLGAVARHYADCVTDSSQLRRKLMSSLQTMISSLQPDMELISGAFMGFGHFMFTFALTPAEREQVFACVRKSIVPVDNMSRYSVATAGMTMIANHIEQFRQELCSDKKTLYYFHSCLKAMCQHKNPELSKLGFKATDAVLRQISRFLLESQINSDGKEIFLNFVSHYIEKLNSEYLVLKDVSQAIRALGIFAGPCKMYMPDEELLKLQDLLVRRVSVTVSDSVTGDMHVHLGSFIDSFSSIGKELMHLDESFLSASEQTAKNMLSEFPKLRPYYKAPVAKSFVSLLWMMHEKETVLEPFWTKIAYHALVLSSISSESESAELGPTDYQEYTVFWKSLFEDSNTLVSEPSAKKNSFRRILYDCIMEVILELPKQLNLNIKEQGAEGSSEEGGSLNKAWSGDTSKLQAENAKDFMILVDYSRFCEWFIANVAPSFFREWIYKFGKQIIAFSTKNPLISAFYKLLAVCLCKCEEARMFADILKRPMDEAELEGLPSEVKDDTDETVQKCYCLFLRFLKEVIFRMEQYKDDLRAACLKLLLSAPIELVDLRRFSVSVVSAFEMGLTFLPLAELALSALETWTHKLPRALLREYFKVILPALEDFLVVDFSPTEDSVDKSAKPLAFSRKASALKKKKSRMATDNSSAMQLQELRIRMLKYLGSIGSDNKMLLHSEATEDLIAWDSKKVLTVRIPFQELVMDFQIDDLLPRIIDLAGSSPDRKLKVAACELLHSLMIIMIGNSQAFLAEKDARNPYHKLYIKVFPVLLQLAADLEPVARDLFRPLTIQLVHWLTRNMQSENPETMALLQSCFDAAVSSNGTLRDFGADCLLEYLKWSIKHATDKELAANPFNVKSLFKRLYLLCGHASPLKRLGAAVIFNRIYREFRESPPLVDLFSLEIFYYFMLSLKISGSEKPAEVGAKHETIKALRHLLKIVEMKSDVFLKPTKNRRPVPALRSPDLPSFVAWLFEQAGGLELQYVHESLEIFDALVKKLSGVINWFQSKIKVDFDFPIRVIEYGSGASASARTKYPFGELEGSNKFTVWLKHILVAFDSYLYLIRCKVINTDAILTSKQSHLAEATEYFIESCLNTNLADTGMTSAEQLAFSKLKSDVVLRVLNFSEVAAKSSPQSLPGFMVAHSMYWKVLAGCILSPDSVGFGIDTASDAQSSLKEILISLIQQFKSSSIKLETLYVELQAECESQAVRELTKEHTPSSYDQQLRKVEGLLFLRKLGLFDEVVLPLGFWTNAYLASLCSRALTLSVAVEINRRDLAASLVELALSEKSFLFGALDLLMPKCSSENNGPLKVYSKLKKTINEALIGDANVAIKFLEERLTHPICMEILASLINTNPISLSNDFLSKLLAEQMLMRRLITRSQSSRADFVNFLLVVLHGRAAAFRKNNELWKPLLNAFASSVAGSRSLAEISELLAVLPDFLTDPDPPVIEECLSDLVSSKFPLSPDDLAQGSEKYIEYDGCIKRLFQAMIASSDNFSVEKALLLHLCSGMENTFSSQFEVAVFQKAQKIESAAFAALTEFCKKYIYETGLPAAVRCRIMERVLFPLLNGCTGRLRSHFFAMNIKMIMDIIAAPLPNQEQELLDAILIRSAHFGLMQICYSSLPATALHSKTGEVLQAFISPDKTGEKELTLALIKAASDVKKKAPPVPNETGYKERLLLNEAAYCAMAACLLATQSRAKVEIFTGYLFAEKPVLWENMINTMEPIHLETDLAEDILQIRLENTQKSSTSVPFQRRSAKYLASQYLANSSLSSVVESNGVRAENDAGSDLSSEAQETPQRSGAKGGPVIDEDWFNSKPFMKSVTGVIWQLSQEEQISRDMPSWMKALLQKLEKRDTHINVVLFLTKIILNLPTLFSPFASSFWKPLARLVAAGDKYGSGLNYFIQDVLLLLIQWSGQNPEAFSGADLELVLSMTRWLVRHTANDSRARIRNNIRLIRSLMENLKNYLIAPTDVLTEFLAIEEGTTPAKPLYFTSVYYIQIFIANSIDPFDLRGLSSPDSDELQFYKKLVKLLSHKSLDVYSLSAECLGHVLRFLKSEKRLIFPDLLEWITQKIGELLSKTDPRQVITITNRITVAFPDITSTFYKRLLYFFPRLDSDMKAKVLETLLSGASELEDLYSELIGIDLMALIRYRHEDCQSFVLGILAVISPKLSSNQVDTILNDAFEYCGSHPSERCRSAFLSLVFQLYRRLDTLSHQAKQLLKLALLNGLSDVVDEIRQSVAAFFEAQVLKDTDIFGRFDELLSEWHLSEVENTFIPAAIQFIFNACKQSPIFDKKIFEHGLPEARFNDRNLAINVDWMGVSSMVPLFAGTQMKTQRNQDDLDESEVGLRATLDMIWTPTQDINPSMARQLFSASAQEIDSVRPQRLSQTQSASTAPTVVRRVRRYAATNPRSFADDSERKKRVAEKQLNLQREARSRKVTLYRRYRDGELPDIEITHKNFIEPLQLLAARDTDFGGQILSLLTIKIFHEMEGKVDEAKCQALEDALSSCASRSSMYFPPFVTFILHVLFDLPKIGAKISPKTISRISISSSNVALGSLVLEKIAEKHVEPGQGSKRQKTQTSGAARSPKALVEIAKMYRAINDGDVYRSIFESMVSLSEVTKAATAAESIGDYDIARDNYIYGLNTEGVAVSDAEPDLWAEGRLHCMNVLGDWSNLFLALRKDVEGNWNTLWEDEKRDIYLPLFVRSITKLPGGYVDEDGILHHWDPTGTPLTKFVAESKALGWKWEYLQRFEIKGLLASAFQEKDFALSQYYTTKAFKNFLLSFSTVPSSNFSQRLDLLGELQMLVEHVEIEAALSKPEAMTGLLKSWGERYPSDSLDFITVWDDIVDWREKALNQFLSDDSRVRGNIRSDINSLLTQDACRIAQAAENQRIFAVADKWLEKASKMEEDFSPSFLLQYLSFAWNKSQQFIESDSRVTILSNIAQHLRYNKDKIARVTVPQRVKFFGLQMKILGTIVEDVIVSRDQDLARLILRSKQIRRHFALGDGPSLDEFVVNAFQLAWHDVQQAVELAETVEVEERGESSYETAKFCDLLLRSVEGKSEDWKHELENFASAMTEATLQSISLGVRKATPLFPRLLQLLEAFPCISATLQTKTKTCPTWVFLSWIPQMTAILDKPFGRALFPLVQRMANEYPNAIRYPLGISSEQYQFGKDAMENAAFFQRISQSLVSTSVQRFILELRRLEDPSHILKDLCERIEALLQSQERASLSREIEGFKDICLQSHGLGSIGQKFSEKHGKALMSLLSNFSDRKFKDLVNYRSKIGAEGESKPGSAPLKTFSTWLDEYALANVEPLDYLEMPGQYGGDERPTMSSIVKISSFSPNVLVMSSMRRPKRLVAVGTDEVEYPWLVKGGEDLRLDQRIQQIFGIMNRLMLSNAYCRRHTMQLHTYKVVPMTSTLGLIEWVNSTKPLKSCMADMPDFDREFKDSQKVFGEFIKTFGKSNQSIIQCYDQYLSAPRASVVPKMQELWRVVKGNYLRDFIMIMAATPEAFVTLRSRFATSLAALNVCSYLLGIGDRHLDNFLVNLKTGGIIGIDFGHAFGSATEVLPVPELVPFRLTKQMERLLLPLGVPVLMLDPMVNTMRAIRDGADTLLNVLNIFVKEPLIEWRKFAVNQLKRQGKSSVSMDMEAESLRAPAWYPQQKLEVARRKLEGENPAYILADELAAGHEKKRFCEALKQVAMGEAGNRRKEVGRRCANAREQVECLVDLAMDPNVLGRSWMGWSPQC